MEPLQTGPFSPPPAPFNPSAPRSGRGRGCSKPMVIGCLVVVLGGGLAVVGGLYYLVTHLGPILERSFAKMEKEMEALMPPDVTPAERQRLHEAFGAASAAMAHPDKLDPAHFNRLQTELFNVSRKGRNLTRDDVRRLTEALEGVGAAGRSAPPLPRAPSPPAPPDPTANPSAAGGGQSV